MVDGMKQYRIIKKSNDAFWNVEKKVWWGWKYEAYAIHVKAALDYVDQKLKDEK